MIAQLNRVVNPAGRISILFFFFAFCWILNPVSAWSQIAVSGQLTIADPAPTGGIKILLYLEDVDSFNYVDYVNGLTIPAESTSVNYDFTTDSFSQGRVRYYCLTNCGDYYESGYYATGGTTYKFSEATVLTGTGNTGKNIALPVGKRVSGQVKLPGVDTAAAGGISVDVMVESVTDFYTITEPVSIDYLGTAAAFSLLLPPDAVEKWKLSYHITTTGQTRYYHTGYYISPVTTTYAWTSATELFGDTTYSDSDMTLIHGRTISGTVSLPAGRVAPAGGFEISMSSVNYKVNGGDDRATVIIPEGGVSGDYTLVMPWDQYNSWEVRYNCGGYIYTRCINERYLTTGYYAGPSSPTFFVSKDYLLWGADNHAPVDLTLINAKAIAGKVTVPVPAPSGGLSFTVYADDPVYRGAQSSWDKIIPAGGTSATYSVDIPDDSALIWRVYHRFSGNNIGYITGAYYAISGTTHLENKATFLTGGMDHYHIDMNAIPDKDNDGIPDSIDPVNNIMNPGVFLLLRKTP